MWKLWQSLGILALATSVWISTLGYSKDVVAAGAKVKWQVDSSLEQVDKTEELKALFLEEWNWDFFKWIDIVFNNFRKDFTVFMNSDELIALFSERYDLHFIKNSTIKGLIIWHVESIIEDEKDNILRNNKDAQNAWLQMRKWEITEEEFRRIIYDIAKNSK